MNFKFTIINDILEQFSSLKEKVGNLSETNYELGLEHLNNGRIWEALSRFKITTFFWPNNYKALYQYGYCLLLMNRLEKAKIVLAKITVEHPKYKEATRLLSAIENQEFDKIYEEYKEKISKSI